MKNGLFHPKVWIFYCGGMKIGIHGSSNMTAHGILKNFEQVTVSQSWVDLTQRYITEKLSYQFERLWENKEDDCVVVSASQALKDRLLREYSTINMPTEEEYLSLYGEATCGNSQFLEELTEYSSCKSDVFQIPPWLEYKTGPFEHQGQAVEAWCAAGHQGILEMATGSGKTITAMICAHRLFEKSKPLLIVVAAPYLPLIEQWCSEIQIFGIKPNNLTKLSGAKSRSRELQKIRRRLRSGISEIEVVVVSHDTLCNDDFHLSVAKFANTKMLVADEVHNLGRKEFVSNTPDFFDYRLALSATPERQYDQEGTEALFDFFGPIVFQFTLQEAIGRCLVKYDYYVHPVYLTEEEMDEWYELTNRIRKNSWRSDGCGQDTTLLKLFRDRRKLLETAKNKLFVLRGLLEKEDLKNLRYTLIYATDKDPEQLQAVNELLVEKGLLFHQLTSEETRQRERCQIIIKNFQEGQIQVLTAKRVLDEGVNIPQINKAFILASNTLERQWVQRRGRLLRTCKETGKTHSEIHDFISLPPKFNQVDLDEDARKLIKSELRRIQEFARSARNAGRADGPLHIIDTMVSAIFSQEV
jgi:superfamily II DNA or RNA helicase